MCPRRGAHPPPSLQPRRQDRVGQRDHPEAAALRSEILHESQKRDILLEDLRQQSRRRHELIVKAMDAIRDKLKDESIRTALSGSSRDFAESSSNTLYTFILALLLVYLILAAQFESFVDPFIIMLTVPLAVAGAMFSLWYFNQTLNIFSQIGMIMLIGLVTKNGILIVEYANHIRDKGSSAAKSAIYASSMRLRPILMTSLAMIFGALPLALSLGAASTSRVPLGIVIVGGILFSLLLSLFIVPVVYSRFSRRKAQTPTAIEKLSE